MSYVTTTCNSSFPSKIISADAKELTTKATTVVTKHIVVSTRPFLTWRYFFRSFPCHVTKQTYQVWLFPVEGMKYCVMLRSLSLFLCVVPSCCSCNQLSCCSCNQLIAHRQSIKVWNMRKIAWPLWKTSHNNMGATKSSQTSPQNRINSQIWKQTFLLIVDQNKSTAFNDQTSIFKNIKGFKIFRQVIHKPKISQVA